MIEVQRARDSVEQLRALRVPLTYREYDMGHEITPRSLTDLSAWLEEKVLSSIMVALVAFRMRGHSPFFPPSLPSARSVLPSAGGC